MDKTPLPAVPLLTGSNYLVWAMKMEAILSLRKLIRAIEERKPEDTATEKLKADWETRNQEAVAYIRLHLSDEQALQFAAEKNVRDLWSKIKRAYAAEDQKIDASNDLKFLRMGERESVSDYIARARGLVTKCASLGLEVSFRELAYYTVRGINNQYKDIREILKTQRDKSLEEIQEILKEKEKEILRKDGRRGETKNAAYVVQKGNIKRCYICGKPGHLAKKCWNRKGYKEAYHADDNYNKRNKQKGAETTKTKDFGKKKSASNVVKTDDCNDRVYAFTIGNSVSKGNISDLSDIWLFDSGASNHMVNDLRWFNNINFQEGELCQAGENSKLYYEGVGTVKIHVKGDANKKSTIIMKDVLYVPKLRENLLSTNTLMLKGFKIVQECDAITVYDSEGVKVLTGKLNGKHVRFFAEPNIVKNSEKSLYNVERIKDVSYEIWHKRLGHVNKDYFAKMCNDNLVDGIRMTCFACDSCNLGKINRKPHRVITRNQSKSPLELIHCDVCGPMPVSSLSGSRYMLVFVDDYSGLYFTYYMKYKSEVFQKLIAFKVKYENLLNTKIKRI